MRRIAIMKRQFVYGLTVAVLATIVSGSFSTQAQTTAAKAAPAVKPKQFATPKAAVDALVAAADQFNLPELEAIFGPNGKDLIESSEPARDREYAVAFAAQAKASTRVEIDQANRNRAHVYLGTDNWPAPVPLVKAANGKWSFDIAAGRREILYRRIGSNELDAIEICKGYVEAQHQFALQKRAGYDVNQYAQRIISTPGKQDGLAWQNPDGTWGGPVGEAIAKAIENGYGSRQEPYHGYYFKVLKGQGRNAPLGQMDFVVKGVMIGGFALIAAPANYRVTGVKTFMVSHDGVVYEKDLGPRTLELAKAIERFDPDKTWVPVD
jgi:hypothetical protein